MRFPRLLILSWIIVIISCSEETVVETPGKFFAVSPVEQLGYANEISIEPIAVKVLNTQDQPMDGVSVHFKVVGGIASPQKDIVVTDGNGVALTFVIFGKDSPHVIVTASTEKLNEVIEFNFDVSSSAASTLQLVSGDGQEGLPGTSLKEAFVVKVTDDFGNVAKKIPVTFKVKEGNGVASDQLVLTNDLGEASVKFTLASTSPNNEILAKIANDSVAFHAASVFATNLYQPTRTSKAILLHWDKTVNNTFTNYVVYRSEISDPTYFFLIKKIDNSQTVEWQDSEVVKGETYFYKIGIETKTGVIAQCQMKQITFGGLTSLDGWVQDFQVDEPRKLIYVSMTFLNEIHVIDIESQKLVDKILIGSRPRGMALSKDGTSLYVALSGSGDIAILNLSTKVITVANAQNALGDQRVYYVIEAAPNRVFATCNTGGGGASTYLTMIKTDEGNQAIRVNNEMIRDQPTLQVDYGKFLYVNAGSNLNKVDVSNDAAPLVLSKTLSKPLPEFILSPDGSRIFLNSGEELNASNFSLVHSFDQGLIALNKTATTIYYQAFSRIKGYDIASFTNVTDFRVSCNEPIKYKLSADGKMFYILSRKQDSFMFYFLDNE